MSSTYDRLVGLLAKGFGIDADEVTPRNTFEELELDSLALVELTLAAQEEFGITLTDDDLQASSSLTQAADVLDAKQVTVR
ncbi:phosphopantetheine-binding protein [Streptomyces brasiliscabiei]|uniref:Phosphopantetheine-binding protein n=1 Tax=Streptomyces brasiliscabiei TaxID=2736302 RepID=A0ABU8GA81_9ACTN